MLNCLSREISHSIHGCDTLSHCWLRPRSQDHLSITNARVGSSLQSMHLPSDSKLQGGWPVQFYSYGIWLPNLSIQSFLKFVNFVMGSADLINKPPWPPITMSLKQQCSMFTSWKERVPTSVIPLVPTEISSSSGWSLVFSRLSKSSQLFVSCPPLHANLVCFPTCTSSYIIFHSRQWGLLNGRMNLPFFNPLKRLLGNRWQVTDTLWKFPPQLFR